MRDKTVSLIIRPEHSISKKSKHSRNLAPLIIIYSHSEWPLRSLAPKNLHHDVEIWRAMSEYEIEVMSKAWRMKYIAYRSWSGLIEDEERCVGKKHPFVNKLRELASQKKYNYIPYYTPGIQLEIELNN